MRLRGGQRARATTLSPPRLARQAPGHRPGTSTSSHLSPRLASLPPNRTAPCAGASRNDPRMNIGGGIAFGLVAALCWGVADFCARGSARTGGTFLTLFYVEIIATLG